MFQFFQDLKIRHKLLLSYASVFIVIIVLFSYATYNIMRKTVEANIETEQNNSTAALLNMVQASVGISIKNHLRAVAERNLEIVNHYYNLFEKGELTEEEARKRAEDVILSQTIGATGYIACVSSDGIMLIHPKDAWVGQDISRYEFVKEMTSKKRGYIEYQWQNPGDEHPRSKALYMAYFEPWDWIINVSSYREEFKKLVNIDDFRQSVLAQHFGRSGYAFVMDELGELIIHPKKQGRNIFSDESTDNIHLRELLAQKNGRIVFSDVDQEKAQVRNQLMIFNYLPETGWIAAAVSYLDERYAPLHNLGNMIVLCLIVSLCLVLPTNFYISNSITTPLKELIATMEKAASGEFNVRARSRSEDEVGSLARYFNLFMDRLENYSHDLKMEIEERKQTEEALRISEEKYRSVMEAAPDPIIVYDMEGRATYLNPAFTEVFGWTADECLGKKLDHFVPDDTWEETKRGLAIIDSGQKLPAVETRRYVKSGRQINVSIRGAVYFDRTGAPVGSVIIHRDITDLKRLEREVLDIGDKEQQKIGQDLHDDLCPHLIGVEGLLKVLRKKMNAQDENTIRLADQITGLIKEAITKSRRLARGLCPVYLVDRGLETALTELANNCETIFGVSCCFESKNPVSPTDGLTATHIFRIAQEAVHNAVKHGDPEKISITLKERHGRLDLIIKDDGRGMCEEGDKDGMGLRIMLFRSKLIGGALEIDSEPGKGTSVHLILSNFRKTEGDDNDA